MNEILGSLGMQPLSGAWAEGWQQSQATFQPPGLPVFDRIQLEEYLAKLSLSAPAQEAFRGTRPLFARQPSLQRLAWHCYRRLYEDGLTTELAARPRLPPALGAAADMLEAFLVLAGLPHLEELHRRRGIDPAITYDTVSDIDLWLVHFHQEEGRWGFKQLVWSMGYMRDASIKLGRLQFQPFRFNHPFRVYRHRNAQRLCVLVADGTALTESGEQPAGAPDRQAVWTSRLYREGACIIGHPLSNRGRAGRQPLRLKADEWQEVFGPGHPLLAIHIPASGPLDVEACSQSIGWASRFFPRHYPDVPFDAFTCSSWLLDNQFEDYLPATSNILHFQRRFHLYPVLDASAKQTIERVFGRQFESLASAPRETSLQRRMLAHIEGGGRWLQGGGFFLRDEVETLLPLASGAQG